MSSGGSSKTPTEQTITQTNIPKEFMPYFEGMMTRAQTASEEPYQPYGGARIAGSDQFADIGASQNLTRQTASQGIAGLPQAQAAAMGNLGRAQQLGQYNTGNFSQFGGFQATQATPFSGFQAGQATPFSDFSEAKFSEFGFGPAGQFTGSSVGQYMNPYMQNVVDIQKGQAQEDYDIARQGRNARAVSAGAFGGSRAAVQEGLAERDLLRRQGDIQAQGLSTAYGDAQRMFGEDRAARMTTEQAQAAERARVQGGSAGEAARVQQARAEELARTQGVNISEAARVQQARAEELARTQGISVAEAARIQAAQAAELGRVQTGTEASRQFGAGQGLAALQASGAAAGQLAGFGEQQRAAQIQNAQMLEAIGRARQGEAQAGLDIAYQDFLRQQNYPREQLGFYSDVLRGLPVAPAGTQTQTGSVYTNPLQQTLGAGLTGLSLYRAYQP
jgi:hypothetical protein